MIFTVGSKRLSIGLYRLFLRLIRLYQGFPDGGKGFGVQGLGATFAPTLKVNTQIDQLGVDINSRFKSNVDHLNVLQKHLKTVNDNIISLANWLGNQPMFATDDDHSFTPPHSVLQGADPSRIVDTKGGSVQKPPHVEAQEWLLFIEVIPCGQFLFWTYESVPLWHFGRACDLAATWRTSATCSPVHNVVLFWGDLHWGTLEREGEVWMEPEPMEHEEEKGSPTELAESEAEQNTVEKMDLEVKQETRKRERPSRSRKVVRDPAFAQVVPVLDEDDDDDLNSPTKRPLHGDAPLSGNEIRELLFGHVTEMKEAWRSFQGRLDRVESEQLQHGHEMINIRTRAAALEKTSTNLQTTQIKVNKSLEELAEDVKKMKVRIAEVEKRPTESRAMAAGGNGLPGDVPQPKDAPVDPWAAFYRNRDRGSGERVTSAGTTGEIPSGSNDRGGDFLSEDEKKTLVVGGWARDTKRTIIEEESAALLNTDGIKALIDVEKLSVFGPRRSVGMMKFVQREGESLADVKNRMWAVIKLFSASKVELPSTREFGAVKTMWASFVKTKAARAKSSLVSLTRRVSCELAMNTKNGEGGIKFLENTQPGAYDCDWNMGTIWCGSHKLASATLRPPRDGEHVLLSAGWVSLDAVSATTGCTTEEAKAAFEREL
ncbi:unnamed protein product [Symbiodinium sp. CCMP2592]|nr:unnamed protein product [Symbiodinium sp. CCMP2592]